MTTETSTASEPETCEDRDYRCCEQLSPDEHEQRYGYKCASDD